LDVVANNNFGDGENAQRFSVEANGEPFWQAVSAWNKGDATINLQAAYGVPNRWHMVPWSNHQAGRGVVAGPCFLVTSYVSLSHSRSLSLDPKQKEPKPSEHRSLSLQNNLLIDPRLRPYIMGLLCEIESAVDDQGREMKASENYQSPQLDGNDSPYLSMQFETPGANAKSLHTLKGTLRLAVLSKSEKWEIDLKATPKAEKSFKNGEDEISVRFGGLTPRLQGWTGLFHIERKSKEPQRLFKNMRERWGNSARVGDYSDTVRAITVLNTDGQPLARNGSSSRSGEQNGAHARPRDLRQRTQRRGSARRGTLYSRQDRLRGAHGVARSPRPLRVHQPAHSRALSAVLKLKG
jgi:hypothetical protein